MSNPVNAAIEAAKKTAAEQAPIEMAQVPATQANGGAVASYAQPSAPTLDQFVNAGVNVDEWLKAGEEGFKIGTKPGLATSEIIVSTKLSDIIVFYGVRYNNPPVYKKSFDHVTCVEGGTWEAAVAQARAIDTQCRGEYLGATLSLTVEEDIQNLTGNAVLLEKGKRLGHTTSITGGKTVAAMIKEARKTYSDDDLLKLKVTYIQKTSQKQGTKPWGVLGFEILGIINEDDVEE